MAKNIGRLAGLAALAGAAYMASKDKEGPSATPEEKEASKARMDAQKSAVSGNRVTNESSYTGTTKNDSNAAKNIGFGGGDDSDKNLKRVDSVVKPKPAAKPAAKPAPKLKTITTRKDLREAEAGMSRGTRTTSTAGAGRGSVNPPSVSATDPRSAEAGTSRGTRTTSTAGAGRGSVNPPVVKPSGPRDSESGMSRGTRPSVVGAGRGTTNPPSVTPQQPAREAEAGMSRGTRNVAPGPGQADIDRIRRIQEASRIPSSMAGRPGYDEAGNPMKKGGTVKKMASGGMTASRRADGIASRGKTRCKMY